MGDKNLGVIVLSGGTSKRFGSDKSQAQIGGATLISQILTAIPSELEIIIAGADPKIEAVRYRTCQESPIGGGPVAGLQAAIQICESEIVALIATDMPFALGPIFKLRDLMPPEVGAVMYVDSDGFRQPFAAIYRAKALKDAFELLGEVHGKSMRELNDHLMISEVSMDDEVAKALIDIDTPADLDTALDLSKQINRIEGI